MSEILLMYQDLAEKTLQLKNKALSRESLEKEKLLLSKFIDALQFKEQSTDPYSMRRSLTYKEKQKQKTVHLTMKTGSKGGNF